MNSERRGALLLLASLGAFLVLLFWISGDPFTQNLMERLKESSREHLLGTDHLGRDFGARLARGGRNSIFLSALCVFASGMIGTGLALLALGKGKKTETFLLFLTDTVMAFPGIVLALVLGSLTGGGISGVIIALVFTGWPQYFRMARSLLKKLWETPFVEAGRLAGFPLPVLFWKYVIPELLPTLGTMASLGWGKTILEISSLGFLGIGLAPPEPELGAMISQGLTYMRSTPRLVLMPGILISLFVLALLLLGRGGTHTKVSKEMFSHEDPSCNK
jgi:ABC-type dipeptide/oligopeptide/nickel transport system permease subunit